MNILPGLREGLVRPDPGPTPGQAEDKPAAVSPPVGPSPTAASAYLLASRDRRRDGQQNRGVRAEEPRHLLGNSTQLSTPCILPFALGRHYV